MVESALRILRMYLRLQCHAQRENDAVDVSGSRREHSFL